MTRAYAQTIGLRTRTSRHDGASARCSVSNRPDQPRASCPFTPLSSTPSTSSAISHPAARSASSETKRSGRGEPPPRPEPELGLPIFARPNLVRVTTPLLEFLIVALAPPAQFSGCNEGCEGRIRRQGREPVFGWRAFALRPFDEQPFFGIGLRAPVIPMRGPNAQDGEAGMQRLVDAFAPCDVTPGAGRQRLGELLGRVRFVLRVAPHQCRRPALPAPCLGRERTGSRRPKAHRGLNAYDITQAHARQRGSKRCVDPVTGVRQHDSLRHALGARGLDLVKGDLRFGLEDDVLGHAGSCPANRIGRPSLGKIEPKGDRQARVFVGYRQRDRDLTIVLLAKLTAILPGDADRMNALLGESCVVDDPGFDSAALFDGGKSKGSNLPQQVLLRPVGVGDKMVQRLMRALDAAGLDAGRYRLHALPLAGKNEPRTVGAKWRPPIRVPQDRRHVLHIRRKSSLASPSIRVSIHRPLRIRRESKPSPQKVYDTVKLEA